MHFGQIRSRPHTSFSPQGREIAFFQENPGWWNIINWPKNIQNSHPLIGGLDLRFWTNTIANLINSTGFIIGPASCGSKLIFSCLYTPQMGNMIQWEPETIVTSAWFESKPPPTEQQKNRVLYPKWRYRTVAIGPFQKNNHGWSTYPPNVTTPEMALSRAYICLYILYTMCFP